MPRSTALPRKLKIGLAILAVLLAVLVLALWLALRASLAPLDGVESLPGLAAAVSIERDARGVPVIRAQSRADLARATGFVHATERFFQMDLQRRAAAGELAALVGPAVVEQDRKVRRHRFRAVARQVLARASEADRQLLAGYAAGVNAGLAALGVWPFEYLVLRQQPVAWLPEDSVLCVLAMWLDLQGSDVRGEQQRDRLAATVPASVYAFIYAHDPAWEAALDGSVSAAVPLPASGDYDLRRLDRQLFDTPVRTARATGPRPVFEPVTDADDVRTMAGSNNWALAGAHVANGAALVANDMHLGLRVPNIWYRARLVVAQDGMDVTGVTLPGMPAVVTGSNGRVAWGFTNSYGDYQDLVVLEDVPGQPDAYLTPQGPRQPETIAEKIEVAGQPGELLAIQQTIWGPIIGVDARGRRLAMAWTAHDPAAVNLDLLAMERAGSLDEAVAIAMRAGIPAQNALVGDTTGRIAWVLMGQIPARGPYDAQLPSSWAKSGTGWLGWVPPERHPRIVDPPGGRAWSANARVVGGDMLALIGDAGYAHGARARQIRDGLTAIEGARPQSFLPIQLDDRAVFLAPWRDRLLALLDDAAVRGNPRRAEARAALLHWTARAAVGDAGYRLAHEFHFAAVDRTFEALTAEARRRWPDFRWRTPAEFAYATARLLDEQPAHLLDPRYPGWRDWLLATADAAIAKAGASCAQLADCTWGRSNTVRIQHPLSRAIPLLAPWLDMPARPLPGDWAMPRVQTESFGASERFAVSPGHESEGYFHMPGGQSGHPLSPFYRAGHDAWEQGLPTPFLPGPAAHTLELVPAK